MEKDLKELLLKDICARLPYGVKMNHIADDEHSPKTLIGIAKDMITLQGLGGYECVDVDHYKPYLFPLSSVATEILDGYQDKCVELELKILNNEIEHEDATAFEVDFHHKHHIDYRGLISKGLAIDATGLNIY